MLFRERNAAARSRSYGRDNGKAWAVFVVAPRTINLAGIVMTHLHNEMISRDEVATRFSAARHRRSLHSASICGVCESIVDLVSVNIFSFTRDRAATVTTFARVNAYRVTSIMLNLM